MQDIFNYTTTNLNGHAPTTGGGTWVVNGTTPSSISTNSTKALISVDGGTLDSGQAYGSYAFTPAANTIYTLQVTALYTGPVGSGHVGWFGMGFSTGTAGGFSTGNAQGPWMETTGQATSTSTGWNEQRVGQTLLPGGYTVPPAAYSATGGIVYTVTWNTSNGQVQYYVNNVLVSTGTSAIPTGTYYAFFGQELLGNMVNCANVTLYEETASGPQMQDNFTYTTSDITGHVPTITPSGVGKWATSLSTGASISTDGTKAIVNTNATGTPGTGSAQALYAFTPFSGSVYTATATLKFTGTTSSDSWAALGFTSAGSNKAPWLIIRPQSSAGSTTAAAAESNGAGWTGDSFTVPASYYTAPMTLTVIWDTSTGISEFFINNLLVLTTPAGSAYIPTGPCNVFFQGFQSGNLATFSNVTLMDQDRTGPQTWMSPDAVGWSELMNSSTWPTALGRTTVLQVGDNFFIGSDTQYAAGNQALMTQAFNFCHAHNIKVSLGTYGLQQNLPCGVAEGYGNLNQLTLEVIPRISAILAANPGDTLDYVGLDGPLGDGVYELPPPYGGGCMLSVAQAATEVSTVVNDLQAAFPSIQWVDVEGSQTVGLHLADMQTFYNDVYADTTPHHLYPATLQIDVDWRNDVGSLLKPVVAIVTAAPYNANFGMIISGDSVGNSTGENAALFSTTNARNMLATVENIREYNASGLPNPLQMVDFTSWTGTGSVIKEYTTAGVAQNASLLPATIGLPSGIAVSGSTLYITDALNGTVGSYTMTGNSITSSTPSLITGLNYPTAIAVSGSDLFIANQGGGTIGEYTTAGAVVNASLITGLKHPTSIAISGTNIFVTDAGNDQPGSGFVAEYTTSGATVSTSLVSGLTLPQGIALSGSDIFVTSTGPAIAGFFPGVVGEYTTSGTVVNASLINKLETPTGIAASSTNLFVNYVSSTDTAGGVVGEYTTSGTVVNAELTTRSIMSQAMTLSGTNLFFTNYGGITVPTDHTPESTYGTQTSILDYFFDSPYVYQQPPNVVQDLYNSTTGCYCLGFGWTDINDKINNHGFHLQNTAGGIEPSLDCVPGLVPLYEYINTTTRGTTKPMYAYSPSTATGPEGTALAAQHYAPSGLIKGYVFLETSEGGTPLLKFYSPSLNMYNYRTQTAAPGGDFVLQGIEGYITPRWTPSTGYLFFPQVQTPTMSPGAGTYSSAQTVTVSTTTAGSTIRYTTDGSLPSLTSPTVASGQTITVSASETLTIQAFAPNDNTSQFAIAAYTISP